MKKVTRLQQINCVLESKFNNLDEVSYFVKENLEFLESHNKNYTRAQYEKIQELLTIFEILHPNK